MLAQDQLLVLQRDDGQVFSCDLTPFKHPMNQVAHKVAPAIAINNRMLRKPSEKVPQSADHFADLLYEAGLPPGMLQAVSGDPREIADELLTHWHVGFANAPHHGSAMERIRTCQKRTGTR